MKLKPGDKGYQVAVQRRYRKRKREEKEENLKTVLKELVLLTLQNEAAHPELAKQRGSLLKIKARKVRVIKLKI